MSEACDRTYDLLRQRLYDQLMSDFTEEDITFNAEDDTPEVHMGELLTQEEDDDDADTV